MNLSKTYNIQCRDYSVFCREEIVFIQNDRGGCKLEFTVIQNGTPLVLEGVLPRLCVVTPVGVTLQQQENIELTMSEKEDFTKISVVLSKELIAQVGTHKAQLQLYDQDTQLIRFTCGDFNYKIKKSTLDEDTVIASNSFSILESLIEEALLLIPSSNQYTDKQIVYIREEFNRALTNVQKQLEGKVDTKIGKGLSTNDYTNFDKNKLANVEEMANRYIHPLTHEVSIITGLHECATNGNAETVRGYKIEKDLPYDAKLTDTTYEMATSNRSGLMSFLDKRKLDHLDRIFSTFNIQLLDEQEGELEE